MTKTVALCDKCGVEIPRDIKSGAALYRPSPVTFGSASLDLCSSCESTLTVKAARELLIRQRGVAAETAGSSDA